MTHGPDDEGPAFGGLTELFPHLAAPMESIPLAPVHVRALAFEDGPDLTLGFVVWKDPGGAARLRRDLGNAIESALLALLSRPATTIAEEGERMPSRLRVLCFDTIEGPVAPALAPFGLAPVAYSAAALAPTMSLVRGEAARCGAVMPDAPVAVWEVPVCLPDAARGAEVSRLELVIRDQVGEHVWGQTPGEFFRALSSAFTNGGDRPLTLSLESLDRIEGAIGQLAPGRIRWIPPMVFQALADTIGVIASKEFGRSVDWALCEPDDGGLSQPPLLRAKLPDGVVHIPIGEHLLRWSMMPLAPGEVPPPLSEWTLDQFGDRTSTN